MDLIGLKVLIVEDDESVARFIKQAIDESGCKSKLVYDGLEAFNLAKSGIYELILLDIMLPGMDGYKICQELRRLKITTPILIITAKDSFEDKIRGLDSGADDYIVKPFFVGELLARMRALARRASTANDNLIIADLSLNPISQEATRGNKTFVLSRTEFILLEYMMRNTGKVLSRAKILEHVWHYDFDGRDNVLDVYISYLRKKIDKDFEPQLIHTIRGSGYWLGVEK